MTQQSSYSANPGNVVRRSNRANILNLLYRKGSMLRADICAELHLTGAAVSRISRELINVNLVQEGAPLVQKGVIGRRSAELSINPNGAFVLALTITANRKSAALFSATGENLALIELEESNQCPPEQIVGDLVSAGRQLLNHKECDPSRVAGIGLGIAIQASDRSQMDGNVTSTVLGWSDVPVVPLVREGLAFPVSMEARAPALLRAEIGQVAPKDVRNVLLINVGLGIGTAGFLDGEIMSTQKSGFCSISHIRHPQSKAVCECGRVGCLEHSAAGAAVVRDCMGKRANEMDTFDQLSPLLSEALERAHAGNRTAKDAFFEAGRKMATGVDTAFAMLLPDEIILAGETGRQPDYFDGLKHGLVELRSPLKTKNLNVSSVTSAEASAAIALDAFVYSEQLNVEQLKVA